MLVIETIERLRNLQCGERTRLPDGRIVQKEHDIRCDNCAFNSECKGRICYTLARGFRIILTNGDRIRAMSNEELAKFINEASNPPICNDNKCKHVEDCYGCERCWLDYLNSPVEESEKSK